MEKEFLELIKDFKHPEKLDEFLKKLKNKNGSKWVETLVNQKFPLIISDLPKGTNLTNINRTSCYLLPLNIAFRLSKLEIMKILCQYGANPFIIPELLISYHHHTPYSVIELLLDYGVCLPQNA